MNRWFRRFLEIIGTSLIWGFVWAIPGLLVGVPHWILAGLISGAGFAVILSIAEPGRRLDELSLWSVVGWGAVGSVASGLLAMPIYLIVSGGGVEDLAVSSGHRSARCRISRRHLGACPMSAY